MRISSLKVLFILVYVTISTLTISALPELCRYRDKQMIVGQTYIDCYVTITCHAKGVVKITDSCKNGHCLRASMWRGHKRFDSRKPYPECCGGPICEDNRILYYDNPIRIHNPKAYIKRSPHVMGIKFA